MPAGSEPRPTALAAIMAAPMGAPPLPVTVAQAPAGGAPQRYVPDVSRAELELGLVPRIGLSDAISRTMSFEKGAKLWK